ncbi:MAG: protein phosphatase 2C domain-containing protein [Lentimicrobium sp.]|jgi:protein phosphatase|nr:protein phosphatase 2C domain-containing protein [Lentimicrobium sp.]
MKIELSQTGSIFSKGRRENMEDFIFPMHECASPKDKLFIVCDGMGGHAKGEIASKLAGETFATFLKPHLTESISEALLSKAFDHVQNVFDDYIDINPESQGMGTTVVLALLFQEGVLVLHCGDSRLYHFREGKIRWKTSDHSLVNEWVKQGLITSEEAQHHPKTNIIVKAIQGKKTQKSRPDLHIIRDILPNDYLLLCTDGIYNGVTESQLTEILATNEDVQAKLLHIKNLCEGNSSDNYSAYLINFQRIN